MNYYDDYVDRVFQDGLTDRDISINDFKESIASNFADSPSYQEVYINSSPTLTGVLIVDNSDVKDSKFILSQHSNPVNAGDIITWNNQKWLTVVKDDMTDVYHKGTLTKCISSLTWLDSDGEITQTFFTYKSDGLTNFGLDDGKFIALGNERRHILIPRNSDTSKLKKGKRFILDERAWTISAIDRLRKGLIYLVVDETEINVADNLELGIADYEGKVANFTITILNGEHFSIRAGQTLQLHTEVRNNGILVDKVINYVSSDPLIATVSPTGLVTTIANGNVTITARLADKPLVMDDTHITVELETVHNYSIELNSEPTITLNTSKTFTAIIKDNLIVDPSKMVYWYLTSDGVNPTDVAQMTFNSTTQCTIKGTKIGTAQLKVVLIGSSPVIQKTFNVQVKSLI